MRATIEVTDPDWADIKMRRCSRLPRASVRLSGSLGLSSSRSIHDSRSGPVKVGLRAICEEEADERDSQQNVSSSLAGEPDGDGNDNRWVVHNVSSNTGTLARERAFAALTVPLAVFGVLDDEDSR